MAKNKSIIKLFEKSGDVGPQPNLLKLLKDIFFDMPWDSFIQSFMDALMSVIISPTPINCSVVNNMIKFAANGVSMLSDKINNNNRSGLYLVSEVFRLCRKCGNSNNKVYRWRFCLLLNHLLNYMSDGALLSVELCDVASILLLDKLQDKKHEIRVQAAHALHRLQTPDNPQCSIVQKFMFHMVCDPSVEVRTAIVKEIAMFNNVVEEMLKNTLLDVSDNVRKEAYNRFLHYPFLSLSSKQRQIILEKGLEDKNENIKSLVKKRLLDNWLNVCNGDFVLFLEKLGVENELICEKTLCLMFESYYDCQVLDLANKYLNVESRLINFDQLTVEKIFLWKCIAKYLTTEKKIELATNQGHTDDYFIDVLLPDLVEFSHYVREYYFTFDTNDDKEFILTQLLDMVRTFSIDDVGITSLNKLCSDLILDNQTSVLPIKSIVVLLDLTFKNGHDILNYVKQILNEISAQTIDVYSLIEKVGKRELLEYEININTKSVKELLNNKSQDSIKIETLTLKSKKLKKQYEDINLSTDEMIQVDTAVKNVLKGFELVYQVQQLYKVGSELSLLTDIIQNFIVGYTECSMVSLRMKAIHSLAPYLLVNNVSAAKEFMNNLCSEISKPLTNKHLLFEVMFELFLRYGLKSFEINDDLDIDEEYEDVFSLENILPLLSNCIDYEVYDSSFKSVVIKGFCNLLIFEKVKSINLLSKLLIIWFRRLSREKFNIYNNLVKFFTSYVFYIRSSSSTLAKCYVPMFKEIEEYNLTILLDIQIDEVNSTLINLIRGLMYNNENMAINAHGELAGYIFDYLLDENQPYTAMLVDTLYKLDINFDDNDELVDILYPKLLRVLKYFKHLDDNKNNMKYLKKLKHKFDPILQKKTLINKKINQKEVDTIETEKESCVASCSTQELDNNVEVHSDLFSQENLHLSPGSDDEDKVEEAFTKLEAMKRMSEVFKKSINIQVENDISSDND